MYQIKVNGVLMPTIYYTLREAMDACAAEKARCSFIRRATMLKEFENWLLNNNYRPTTAFDY